MRWKKFVKVKVNVNESGGAGRLLGVRDGGWVVALKISYRAKD